MAKLFANSGDPDQTPRSAASDLGLHCFPITLLQWVRLSVKHNSSFSKAPVYTVRIKYISCEYRVSL